MQEKGRRQQKLLSLIRTQEIGTQTKLVSELKRAGFDATQSSVSRDLEELGIVKQYGAYVVPSTLVTGTVERLKSLKLAGESLIVARTESGFASALTVEIDRAQIPEIIGTIAGDDTIFIAIRNKKHQDLVLKSLNRLFESKANEEASDNSSTSTHAE